MGDPAGNSMGESCCEAARNGDCGAGHRGRVGENWVSCWDSVCRKQDKARATMTCVVRTTRQLARTTRAEHAQRKQQCARQVPVAACSTASWTAAAVPVVQLHVAVVAVSHLLLWFLQQLLAVLQEADTPSPWAAWARGLH